MRGLLVMSISKKLPAEVHTEEYFGCEIKVWRPETNQYTSFPWRYAISFNGKTYQYPGISNNMKSKKEALTRAHWKAKCLALACKPVNTTSGLLMARAG